MKKLLHAAALAAALFACAGAAFGQPIAYTDVTPEGVRITRAVGPLFPLPVRCYSATLVAESCGGSGSGGSLSATASASPTPVVAGTDKPLNIGLFSNLFATLVDNSGGVLSFADQRPASSNITVVDSGTSTAAGQSSVSITTGTPTANSFQTTAVDGMASGAITVTGTFVATLQIEGSYDGGTTYSPVSGLLRGSSATTSTITGQAVVSLETAGMTHLRVRATAYTSGTAAVKMAFSSGTGGVKILNPVRLTDGTNTMAVKAASTAPATTDPAAVVAISPVPSLTCPNKVTVSLTASTDLVTFTNSGYICSIVLIGASAETWGLVEGTGSVCATGITAVLGGTTGTLSFAANGGFVAVSDRAWLKTAAAAKHLCLVKSGAGNISGVITYADAS